MNSELVSVIIPTFNRAQFLERAISSVIDQTYPFIEIIIVDDGSTDETPSLVRSIDWDLHYVATPHRGVSAARNRGIGEARGEWIAFLDSDDYWLCDKIEKQMLYLYTVFPDDEAHERYLICHTDEIWIRNGKRINQSRKHMKYAGWFFKPSLNLCLISPSAVILNRSIFDSVGYFDESFEFVEDYDLWLRITAQYPIGYLNERLTVKHGGHEDQLSGSIDGIEKYRIRALEKIITSGTLRADYLEEALKVYNRKASIYIEGCRKRGKHREAKEIQERMLHLADITASVRNKSKSGYERIGI